MKNECIWKCQNGKVIVKVVKVIDDWRFHCATYRVYVGRKWWNHVAYYEFEKALTYAAYISLLGSYNVTITRKS